MRGIVQHKLLQLLEKRSPPYKVCWHLRDFIVGVPINEQITNSIQQSRKIIFVFSEHFVESQFCCSELDQALDRFQLTRTRCILPIVLDEETVPKKVKSILTYWPLVNLNDSNVLERITRILGKFNIKLLLLYNIVIIMPPPPSILLALAPSPSPKTKCYFPPIPTLRSTKMIIHIHSPMQSPTYIYLSFPQYVETNNYYSQTS